MEKKNNMLPRTCRECGAVFLGGPRAFYCPECRAVRIKEGCKKCKERMKTESHVPLGSIIPCELCGVGIVKRGGNQHFCPECAKKHLKEVDNAQSQEWKKNNPEKYREAKREFSRKRHRTEESRFSGLTGVDWDKGNHMWVTRPYVDGKQVYVGKFVDLGDAVDAYYEFMDNKKGS